MRRSVSADDVGRESRAVDLARRQAGAVDRDRVARRELRWRAPCRSRSARPPRRASTPTTVPTSADQPREHHHSRSRAEISRSSPDPLAVERQRADRLGDPRDALALERVARTAPAEQHRREEEADLVDLAGVQERAARGAARPRAGSTRSRRRRAGRAPSARAPARSRRSPRSPRRRPATSASVSVRAAARETTTISGTSAAAPTSCEESGRRASESKTTRRGWRCTFSTRAVSCGSSASAVPMPIATASTDARQWWASSRLSTPEIHFESPSRVATLPSSVIADLKSTHGRPVRACLRNAWLSSRARVRELAVGDDDLDALVAQDPQARGPTPSRSGRRCRRRRGGCRRRGSRRCTAACGPWWQHGSSET